ncbi:MAG: DUF1902 domain-containing protein [Methylococcaceae bacterium]|nr:MAG: DUF1902 domain-containing protein [Methylococcaceae bacterium]
MQPTELTLRCYAECERDGTWFALCLDLNLYARADTAETAKAKLHEIIRDYVTEACTVDLPYFEQLIPRRAPWIFWLHYYWYYGISLLYLRPAYHFHDRLPLVPV